MPIRSPPPTCRRCGSMSASPTRPAASSSATRRARRRPPPSPCRGAACLYRHRGAARCHSPARSGALAAARPDVADGGGARYAAAAAHARFHDRGRRRRAPLRSDRPAQRRIARRARVLGIHGAVAVFDQIVTEPQFGRRGLGSAIMATLGGLALGRGVTGCSAGRDNRRQGALRTARLVAAERHRLGRFAPGLGRLVRSRRSDLGNASPHASIFLGPKRAIRRPPAPSGQRWRHPADQRAASCCRRQSANCARASARAASRHCALGDACIIAEMRAVVVAKTGGSAIDPPLSCFHFRARAW